jgi:hypothetical protein
MEKKLAFLLGIILDVAIPVAYLITMLLIRSYVKPVASLHYIEGVGYIFSAVSLIVPFAVKRFYEKSGKTLQGRMVGYAFYEIPAVLGLVYFLIGGKLIHGTGLLFLSVGYFFVLDKYVFGDGNEEN